MDRISNYRQVHLQVGIHPRYYSVSAFLSVVHNGRRTDYEFAKQILRYDLPMESEWDGLVLLALAAQALIQKPQAPRGRVPPAPPEGATGGP